MKNIQQKLEKYMTKRARSAMRESLVLARQFPDKIDKNKANTAHLLCALAKEEGSISKNILSANGVKISKITAGLKNKSTNQKINKETQELSLSYKKALKKAASYAMRKKHYFIGTEHLLYGVLGKKQTIDGFSVTEIKKIKEHLDNLMVSYLSFDMGANTKEQDIEMLMNIDKGMMFENSGMEDVIFSDSETKSSKTTALESFCDNLSRKAANGTLDPLIGREDEIKRIIRILSRKTKNNPLLIGDAGVGKTAIIEGLAQKINQGDVPVNLLNKTVYSLNLGYLVAGTLYRGEFEERIHDLIDEAEEANVILFIDEIHILPGSGSAQGSLDASNLLKPVLAGGLLQCIGATTYEEYKKSIEKDPALDRRFQKIFIKQQTSGEAIKTLTHLKQFYEKHHSVRIPQNIINLCVELSVKYIPSRFLPDKALDVLDEAAAFTRAETMVEKEIKQLKILETSIINIIIEKEEALKKEHYKKATQLKSVQESLEKKIYKLQKNKKEQNAFPKLSEKAVYIVISEIAGIPLSEITKKESDALSSLEKTISNNVMGQKDAVKKVAKVIRRNRTGVRQKNRPMASLLFMGPSGVGKTKLAKVIAHIFSNTNPSEENESSSLIKLDMSEYSEAHTIARLIGAPPGYVGYEEAGILTDKIRKNPYSVVLFDEIEKANPRIFNILLQIFEEGVLTDSQGKNANFKNAFIILTSNIGSEYFKANSGLGFSSADSKNKKQSAMKNLKETLKPEIINRLDDILIFDALDKKALEKIAKLQLNELKSRMQTTLSITFENALPQWLANNAHSNEKGARGIRKIIETHIEDALAEFILNNNSKKEVKIGIKAKKLVIK